MLNEAAQLPCFLRHIAQLSPMPEQVILVDGGSTDASPAIATTTMTALMANAHLHFDWQLVHSKAGRALQMNTGAALATGDILLFLHADTRLPTTALSDIKRALAHSAWGRFDVCLDSDKPVLKLVGRMINMRSRLTGIATGDQAIFIKRALFEQIGGYPNHALMEDIELCKRLKVIAKPTCLHKKVITSARRWQQHGTWRTIMLMWQLRFDYWRGASPERLKQRYYKQQPLKNNYHKKQSLKKANHKNDNDKHE